MRIPSGVTDQYIYFVAVDSTDLKTRETGLTTFTVYRSRDGGAAAAMTTPTVNETDTTNMPGVYELLLDEDMTIGSGNDSEEMCFHITQASMAPVTRVIELYRPKITAGNTLGVAADGDVSGNVDGSVASVVGHTAQTGDTYALANGAQGFAAIDTVVDGIQSDLDNATDGLGAIKAETALIVADTNELQTDWANAGRLDAILDEITVNVDAIETDTQDIQTQIGTAGAGLTDITINAASVDAILDETLTAHVTADSLGVAVKDVLADTADMQPKIGSPVADLAADIATVDTVVDGIQTDLDNATDGLGAIKTAVDAIPTAPALASVCTEARLSELDEATAGKMANQVDIIQTDTTTDIPATITTLQTDLDSFGITKNAVMSNVEFNMVLTSDHYTAATGKTVTGERSIDGGAFTAVAGTIAEVGDGVYQFDALAADTNGDVITWKFSEGTCDDTFITFTTRV